MNNSEERNDHQTILTGCS